MYRVHRVPADGQSPRHRPGEGGRGGQLAVADAVSVQPVHPPPAVPAQVRGEETHAQAALMATLRPRRSGASQSASLTLTLPLSWYVLGNKNWLIGWQTLSA